MNKNSSNSSKKKSGNTRQISPAKHWFLTLNNYKTSDIDQLLDDSSIKRYVFQEEKGESGTPHLQGHFEFSKKIRPSGHFKGSPLAKGHWEKTRNRKKAIEYCSKLSTKIGKTYRKGFPRSLFRKVSVLKKTQLYNWQLKIVNEIEQEPDDRTINWIWDTDGNKGKSALVKYLCVNEHAIIVSGKSSDIKYQIANMEFPPDIILYDIPRTARGYINYTALEELSNGCFASNKYESKMCIIPNVHIYCFANFHPEFEAMSQDRWKIVCLDN